MESVEGPLQSRSQREVGSGKEDFKKGERACGK